MNSENFDHPSNGAPEHKLLSLFRTLGWINVAVFMYLFFILKEGSLLTAILIAVSAIISLAGTIFYYFFWEKILPGVDKELGFTYFKPYRLGATVLVFYGLYAAGIHLFGDYQE